LLLVKQKEEVEAKNKEVEDARKSLEEKAEQLTLTSKYKSEFLANMSHELRTPLNAVTGYTELIQEGLAGPVTERQEGFLEKVKANARHQLRVIEEILEYSRMEGGREEVRVQRVDLSDQLREVASFIEPLAREKNLGFRLRAPSEPLNVETDPAKLRHILLNLLSNAVKFTERGDIELRARVSDGTLEIQVADTGVGIRPEDQEKVFEAFAQLEEATTREKGGTGLGLAVARRLARMLGGDVSVESEVGRGSTFTVDLPAGPRRT
jgi:signal transduction histidine kinase